MRFVGDSRSEINARSERKGSHDAIFGYPLNYGNNDIFDFRFSIADCKQCLCQAQYELGYLHYLCLTLWPRDLLHQRNKPSAAGDFEFAEDGVQMLFHHRQTQAGVISDLLVTPPFTDKSRNFLFAPGESDNMR